MEYIVTYLSHTTWQRTVAVEADSISDAWGKVMADEGCQFIDCEKVKEKCELVKAEHEPDWEAHAAVTMGVK